MANDYLSDLLGPVIFDANGNEVAQSRDWAFEGGLTVTYSNGKVRVAGDAASLVRPACHAAATANVTVSNPGTAVFDGVTLTSGQRVFLPLQTSAAESGPWVFNGSSSALTRPADFDATADLAHGVRYVVTGGALWRNVEFVLATASPTIDGTKAWLSAPERVFDVTAAGGAAEQTLVTLAIASGYEAEVRFQLYGAATGERLTYSHQSVWRNPSGTVAELTSFRDEVEVADDAAWNPNVSASGGNVLLKATPDASNSTRFYGRVWLLLRQL